MKLTRRQVVIAAAGTMAGSITAVNAAAQVTVPSDPNQQALDDLRQSADDLAKVVIPMDTAPAFQFKA